MKQTTAEIIRMIDEYLEEPNCIDPKWVEALIEIKKIISAEQRKDTDGVDAPKEG
jgi:hypothetical protein